MRISKIQMKNFRQYKNAEIEFYCNDNRNVTIIVGENGYGKTTLIRAFLWCLYGTVEGFRAFKIDNTLLNKDVAYDLDVGKTATTQVVLEFMHKDTFYKVTTEEEYIKNSDQTISVKQKTKSTLIKQTEDDPDSKIIKDPSVIRNEIDNILGEEIKDYFFYDGENNRIEQVGTTKSLKKVISDMMGIKRIEDLNDFFKPIGKNTVISVLHNQRKEKNGLMLANALEERGQILTNIEENRHKAVEYNETIKQLEQQKKEKEQFIEANLDAQQCQSDLITQKLKLDEIQINLKNSFDYLLESFQNRDAFLNVLFSYIFREKELDQLEEESSFNSENSISHISEEAIDQLIQRGYCLCGRKIETDSDAYEHLINEKSHMEPHDYGKYVNDFVQEEFRNSDYSLNIEERIQDTSEDYISYLENYERIQTIIKELEQKLEGRSDVGEIQKDLKNIEKQQSIALGALEYIESTILPKYKEDLKKKDKELSLLNDNSKENKLIDRSINYAEYIYELSKRKIEKQTIEVREKLEKNVNFLFRKMYHGDRTLRIDNDFKIESRHNDNFLENSTGTETVKNYAFIGALLCVAREVLLEEKDDFSNPEDTADYPLVMDAPFSNTDETHIKNISRELPSFCDQLIIVLIEKDYKIAEETLRDSISEVYRINKISETEDRIEKVKSYV